MARFSLQPKPWLLFTFAVSWAACSMSSLQTPSQRRPYDRESSSLHPEMALHRRADASALDVYLRIPREELLYSRLDGSSPFVAQLRVELGDTTWHLLDTAWADTPSWLTHSWTYSASPLPMWEEITVVDVLRNAAWSTRRMVAPSDRWGNNDVLVWSTKEGWPLTGEHAQIGDTLVLHLPPQLALSSTEPVVWDMSNAAAPTSLPPPPYSSSRLRWDTLRPTPLGSLQADSVIVLVVPDGTTLLQLRGSNVALRFHGVSERFPELIEAEELIAPLRYIASRSEFQRLQSAEHPKHALDEFWLACASSPESARGLLNTYYGRVEEANAAFSGMVEGWRTDRGMIHVVFGVPQRVRRDMWNEYWIYGEEGTANALTFHFRKRSNILDDNHFELQRSIQFRSVWDRGISNWRNGRVRGD
jgi:GWxTD domain-containing protein